MKRLFFLILLSSSTLPAFAEDASTEVLEIFKKADKAAREVRSARFRSTVTPTGLAVNFFGTTEGQGVVEGWDGELERPRRFWSHVKTKVPGSGEEKELSGGGDGDTFFLIDHTAKKAYSDMDPGVLGSSDGALTSVGLAQFVHPEPYRRELEADSYELLGKETVAGTECYKIRVAYGGTEVETAATWWLSTEDFLPRRRVRHFSVPRQGEGTLEITLTELAVDPTLEADLFQLKLPEGYEQIDDFAP